MHKKKSLGQHFLHSFYYLRAIADAGDIKKDDWIVEVGPGDGALTSELIARGAHVIAIEKDIRLIPILNKKFMREITEKKLRLYEGDIQTFSLSRMKLPIKYKVIANIPYYITGILLKKFLTDSHQPTLIVFLTQKEVAERIAKSTKESILSLSVKVYGTPTLIKKVPRHSFVPVPKVDSAILQIKNISRNYFSDQLHEKRFFELLRSGFGQKRKFLKKNIERVLGSSTKKAFEKAGISDKARAEDVPLKQWLLLARII